MLPWKTTRSGTPCTRAISRTVSGRSATGWMMVDDVLLFSFGLAASQQLFKITSIHCQLQSKERVSFCRVHGCTWKLTQHGSKVRAPLQPGKRAVRLAVALLPQEALQHQAVGQV